MPPKSSKVFATKNHNLENIRAAKLPFRVTIVVLAACLILSSCLPDLNARKAKKDDAIPSPTIIPLSTTGFNRNPALSFPSPNPLNTPTPVTIQLKTSLPTVAATSTPIVMGVFAFPADVNPLTGLKVADPGILERRPVMVKVSNYPRYGRPHAGLSAADIVFEYYIGEEANRFLAIYYGKDSNKIGPIRSGRLVDTQLGNLYQGVLVYGSADPQVEVFLINGLGRRAVSFNTTPCPPICGLDTHSVAGVFADSAELTKYVISKGIDNSKPDLRGMTFDERIPSSNYLAVNVAIEYSRYDRGEWHYDPNTHQYKRWIEDIDSNDRIFMAPLTDRNTGKQLEFANIILLYATYIEYAPTLHNIIVRENNLGKDAYYFRDGVMIEGKWRVLDSNRPIQLLNEWGLPVALKPGNTWIVLVGDKSQLSQPSLGQWELQFDLP